MIESIVSACRRAVARAPVTEIGDVARILEELSPVFDGVRIVGDLPWGRYVLHAEPAWNVQLDVFSDAYQGGVHAHGTWGAFWVLRGGLASEDFESFEGDFQRTRVAWVPAGGAQGFCPPLSDWHRVSTRPGGPQTVSVHLYGPGFDLDTGVALDGQGRPRSYPRSAPCPHEALAGALVAR